MPTGDPISRENEREISPETTININMARGKTATMDTGSQQVLKYVSLVSLMLQNVLLIIVMRYTRTRKGAMYMATTAVIMGEIIKFSFSLLIIYYQQASMRKFVLHIQENILQNPIDFLKVSLPSLMYTLQNNLLFLAVSNLDAATFQVTYQLKIITTAIFSVLMMKKYLSRLQWVSLVVLFIGVSIVQLQPENTSPAKTSETGQQPLIGLLAVIISAFMSGFSGVYFEKILKGTKPSVWIRNVQLGVLGSVIGFITMELKEGAKVRDLGFFYGYDFMVWCVILLQSVGGLLVAVVVKYADNILKGFATSAAIIVSCIISILFFDFKLSLQFTFGASCVMTSIYMYGKFAVPQTTTGKTYPGSNGKVASI